MIEDLRPVFSPFLVAGPYLLVLLGAFVLPCHWRYRLGIAILVCALISVTVG